MGLINLVLVAAMLGGGGFLPGPHAFAHTLGQAHLHEHADGPAHSHEHDARHHDDGVDVFADARLLPCRFAPDGRGYAPAYLPVSSVVVASSEEPSFPPPALSGAPPGADVPARLGRSPPV